VVVGERTESTSHFIATTSDEL